VSNNHVNTLYERARSAGAIGGKLTGAGGGGFLLLFAKPEKHDEIREELSDLIHVPIKLDHSGSQIVYYEPEQDYSTIEQFRASHPIAPFRELEVSNSELDPV
jgi:D-glycero-alpha-D-manno-heptose-7-phosphate kinase